MAKLKIVDRRIDELKPHPNNPRTHSQKQIQQIAASIDRFGFNNPVLIDGNGKIIAGHGRVEAAKLVGRLDVPTICIAGMSEDELRAYIIADNRLAENAGWDPEILAIELAYLSQFEIEIDPTITGFEMPEIDIAIDALSQSNTAGDKPDPADVVPEATDGVAITQLGDIWAIGRHRLICGDATDADVFVQLLGAERAQMVFCDPPYNVPIDGHVSGNGEIRHREFAMASGEMSSDEFTGFLKAVFDHLVAFSSDGSIHFQCMDWRHLEEISAAGGAAYTELKNLCVWSKTNAGMGSLYRSQHELVFVFKSGAKPHINNVQLGKHGRFRTNVWNFAGVNSFGKGRGDLALHPTVKPVALVAEAIRDCSHRNGIVLDAFAGSGTTMVAAQKTGRCGYGIELDPLYCDVIVRRMRTLFGLEATLVTTDRTFESIEAERQDRSPSPANLEDRRPCHEQRSG